MRRMRALVGLLVFVAAGVLGCKATETRIRLPKNPEEYKAPPDEPRYSRLEYPAETMDQDMLLKKKQDNAKAAPGPMRGMGMGAGGRMPGM